MLQTIVSFEILNSLFSFWIHACEVNPSLTPSVIVKLSFYNAVGVQITVHNRSPVWSFLSRQR